ncbi:MAG: RidA family protein [Magnetococcales bacterium]|nr:RidA family protein [Magnetococcales bacterium]
MNGKQAVGSAKAPPAIGPYSQAVRSGAWLFLSGQIPLDPATGEPVAGGAAEQTRQVMDNLTQVLAAAGAGWDQVVKTTLYLTDPADFPVVNGIYQGYLTPPYPARATVGAAWLPRGVRVAIEGTAHVPEEVR